MDTTLSDTTLMDTMKFSYNCILIAVSQALSNNSLSQRLNIGAFHC